jgi:hypothetical protein
MSLSQEVLHDRTVDRITAALPAVRDATRLSTVDDLLAVEAGVAAGGGTAVVAVVRRFDLVAWIRGTVTFAAGLGRAEQWRGSFTKTLFLVGNPANLVHRFAFGHIDETGTLAWTAPAPAAAQMPLRRLLRAFVGQRELTIPGDVVVDLPGRPGVAWMLYIAGTGLTVAQAMVHLNHLLVEAVLDGILTPGDRLTVRRVPRLVGLGPFDALRVVVDPALPGKLHALMGLTTEVTSA